jgi:type III pantothenate kinase
MIFAAVDIGNTNIKTGIFENGKLKVFRFFNSINGAESFWGSVADIKAAAISSVVPSLTKTAEAFFKSRFGFKPFIVSIEKKFNISIKYLTPETLGMDRVCSCEGALFLSEQKSVARGKNRFIITSDLGTATTVNIVNNNNEFIGGLIAPGLFTMAGSLFSNTAQLPDISFGSYAELVGRDTKTAIESGIINSTIGLYKTVLERLEEKYNSPGIDFYFTGGNARLIQPHVKFNNTLVEELVIYGIKQIFDLNNND